LAAADRERTPDRVPADPADSARPSLVRPTGNGISLVTDHLGRTIASRNGSTSNDGILLASVPSRGVSTIYSHVGDAFAYLCTVGLVLGIHLARRAKRRETGRRFLGTSGHAQARIP